MRSKKEPEPHKIQRASRNSTWNQSCKWLIVLVSVSVRLPPVWIRLTDDVEDISFLEGQAQLSTGYIGVIWGVVVEVSFYVDLKGEGDTQSSDFGSARIPSSHPSASSKLTTVSLTGGGLIWLLGINTKVRSPCMSACHTEEHRTVLQQTTTLPISLSCTRLLTRMSKTWLTSFPRISMPLISRISSPSDRSPLRSAAPPRTMRLITTLSISFRTVAPCSHRTDSIPDHTWGSFMLYGVWSKIWKLRWPWSENHTNKSFNTRTC